MHFFLALLPLAALLTSPAHAAPPFLIIFILTPVAGVPTPPARAQWAKP